MNDIAEFEFLKTLIVGRFQAVIQVDVERIFHLRGIVGTVTLEPHTGIFEFLTIDINRCSKSAVFAEIHKKAVEQMTPVGFFKNNSDFLNGVGLIKSFLTLKIQRAGQSAKGQE
ncbi:hypothetical protein SDC9_106536 [bioreactor metagenome]|uniref:Uncharacterized protein n=1 Tax=bioreactor metagenome TaxID=1076179 RepID=A0A645B2K8_9ZZZZ